MFFISGQHRTIPALRLKHRSGICRTSLAVSALRIMRYCPYIPAAMLGAGPQDCFDDTIIPYHSGKKHAENDHICTAFRRTFCATGL